MYIISISVSAPPNLFFSLSGMGHSFHERTVIILPWLVLIPLSNRISRFLLARCSSSGTTSGKGYHKAE